MGDLRLAAIHGDLAAINRALADGADPNAADDDGGCFPLIFAVSGNHTECAARLIEAGANPNCHMNQHLGITPLNLAASYTNRGADVVRVLLAGGAQVDFNSRGTRLPADVVPNIVEYWAHLGCYQYQIPGLSARARRAARRERRRVQG